MRYSSILSRWYDGLMPTSVRNVFAFSIDTSVPFIGETVWSSLFCSASGYKTVMAADRCPYDGICQFLTCEGFEDD